MAEVEAEQAATQPSILNCDLDCFADCLGLKSYSPYEVVETCVTKKCLCPIDEATTQLAELKVIEESPQRLGAWGIIWRIFFAN